MLIPAVKRTHMTSQLLNSNSEDQVIQEYLHDEMPLPMAKYAGAQNPGLRLNALTDPGPHQSLLCPQQLGQGLSFLQNLERESIFIAPTKINFH